MTSRQTVIAFGIYLFLTGLTLIFAPGLLAKMLFLPLPSGPYYLVLGLVVIVLAYYYVRLGREGSQAFVQATVVARLGFAFAVGLHHAWCASPRAFDRRRCRRRRRRLDRGHAEARGLQSDRILDLMCANARMMRAIAN